MRHIEHQICTDHVTKARQVQAVSNTADMHICYFHWLLNVHTHGCWRHDPERTGHQAQWEPHGALQGRMFVPNGAVGLRVYAMTHQTLAWTIRKSFPTTASSPPQYYINRQTTSYWHIKLSNGFTHRVHDYVVACAPSLSPLCSPRRLQCTQRRSLAAAGWTRRNCGWKWWSNVQNH